MAEEVKRPSFAPDPGHPLLEAARYNDAFCEEHGLLPMIERGGLVPDEVMYVAQQRALRVVLIESHRLEETMNVTQATRIELTPEENAKLLNYIPIYLDAIMLGWKANQLERNGNGESRSDTA